MSGRPRRLGPAAVDEATALRAAVELHGGNLTAAGAALGCSDDTLRRRLVRHGLLGWLAETFPVRVGARKVTQDSP